MKIFGCSEPRTPIEQVPELVEITLNATPVELRRIGDFLLLCASEMERMGAKSDHLHLADCMEEFRQLPHLVDMRSAEREL